MSAFAEIHLGVGILAWVAVGLIPGFVAARVYRGGRYGPVGDYAIMAAGTAGAVATGCLLWAFAPPGTAATHPVPVIGAAAAVALLTVGLVRLIFPAAAGHDGEWRLVA